ncbi:MAG: hypothetical protein CSA62_04810 [Planctomycetota bacterium]|nr:MAG: hypothetical protein CSA62_04810 [Planctomycetota bacterium]
MGGTLTCLGTGSILPSPDRSTASYLLGGGLLGEAALLLDAGPGCMRRLAELSFDSARIRHVLLSHYHLDHHVDLLTLLFQRKNPDLQRRAETLHVYGPPGLKQLYQRWVQAYGSWVSIDAIELRELRPGKHELEAGLCVGAFDNDHSASGFCYRIEMEGRVLAYSGDTAPCGGLDAACVRADLALVECSFPDHDRQSGHMWPSAVRELIRSACPRRIGLTHFYPEMASIADDPLLWAELWSDIEPVPLALSDKMELPL